MKPVVKTMSFKSSSVRELRRIRKNVRSIRAGYREALNKEIERAIEQATAMRNSANWLAFRNMKYWQNEHKAPRAADRPEALRYVLRYIFGSGDAGSKKANMYYHAIRPLMRFDKEPADIVAEILANGGFKKVASKHAHRRKTNAANDNARSGSSKGAISDGTAAAKAAEANGKNASRSKPKPGKLAGSDTRPTQRKSSVVYEQNAHLVGGEALLKMPAGSRFEMTACLKEAGKVVVIEVFSVDRIA